MHAVIGIGAAGQGKQGLGYTPAGPGGQSGVQGLVDYFDGQLSGYFVGPVTIPVVASYDAGTVVGINTQAVAACTRQWAIMRGYVPP